MPTKLSQFTNDSNFVASSDVLTKTNTTTYTPTANYHPATKKYVDDNAGGDIYHVGTSPPSDSNLFWVDTSE